MAKTIFAFKYNYNYYCTHCDSCEKKCHYYCDCSGNSLGRCKEFRIIGEKICEECGCSKNNHKIDYYKKTKKKI